MTPCCGNCKWWKAQPEQDPLYDRAGLCNYPLPVLPVWVTELIVSEGEGYTVMGHSASCPTFAAKERG